MSSADLGVYTALKHDRTTMMTGSFSLLSPVYSAALDPSGKKKGKLSPYHTDQGHSVTRSYECEVTFYKKEKEA